LKIADIAMPVAAAPAAGGAAPAAAAAPAGESAAPAEEAAPAAAEKAVLTVKLESFDAAAKAKVIREVKTLLGCNLVEAKNLVEKAPTILKENVVKDVITACDLLLILGCEQSQRIHGKAWSENHIAIDIPNVDRRKRKIHPTLPPKEKTLKDVLKTETPRVYGLRQPTNNDAMLISTQTPH